MNDARCLTCFQHGTNVQQSPANREDEPQEGWVTETEKEGGNPMNDPVAKLGLFALLFPFILLGILLATGVIDTSN
jgi:hypothetical protein